MTDTERIIEAVARLFYYRMRRDLVEEHYTLHFDLFRKWLTALVNLAMSGVCPACKRYERRGLRPADEVFMDGSPPQTHPHICSHPYHDHREALDALLAERG